MGGFATYDKGGGVPGTTVYADNVDFTGTGRTNTITTNGQLLIGSTASNAGGNHINVGQLVSANSSITIGYSSPNITLTVNGSLVGQTITGNTGGALSPTAGNWNIVGTGSVSTSGAASTLTISVAQGGFTWTDVTGATQTLAAQNGYVTDRGAGVTYTLPASGTIGDTIKIVGKLGLATITPNANQQILIGSSSGAVGVTGTAVSNNVGDCLELICITAGASTVWRADSVIGTWTLN